MYKNALEFVGFMNQKKASEVTALRPSLHEFYKREFIKNIVCTRGIRPEFKSLSRTDDKQGVGIKNSWLPTETATDCQVYLENNMLNRFPNTGPEYFNWLCSVYPNWSQDLFSRATSRIAGAIFQEGNYDITADKRTIAELDKKQFLGYDFYDFMRYILLGAIMDDPNGFLYFCPVQSKKNNSIHIEIIPSTAILVDTSDLVVFRKAQIITIIDKENVFTYTINKKGEFDTPKEGDGFTHDFGEMPLHRLGGKSEIFNNQIALTSFFSGAIGWTPDAIREYIAKEAYKKMLFPVIQRKATICHNCAGDKKIRKHECSGETEDCYTDCNVCGGNGFISHNLGEDVIVPDGEEGDALKHIAPPTDILVVSANEFEGLYRKIEKALFLTKTDAAQSGLAKAYDEEDEITNVSHVSGNIFNVVTTILHCIDIYTTGISNIKESSLQIKRPATFFLKSEKQLQEELADAINNNAPKNVCETKYRNLISSTQDSKKSQKIIDFLLKYDPYLLEPRAAKIEYLKLSVMSKIDFDRNMQGYSLLLRLIATKSLDTFLQMADIEIANELDTVLMAKVV